MANCHYKECGKEIDLENCCYDTTTENYFCGPGCRDMWYSENGSESLGVRMKEKGIERLISGQWIIELNGKG